MNKMITYYWARHSTTKLIMPLKAALKLKWEKLVERILTKGIIKKPVEELGLIYRLLIKKQKKNQ